MGGWVGGWMGEGKNNKTVCMSKRWFREKEEIEEEEEEEEDVYLFCRWEAV